MEEIANISCNYTTEPPSRDSGILLLFVCHCLFPADWYSVFIFMLLVIPEWFDYIHFWINNIYIWSYRI